MFFKLSTMYDFSIYPLVNISHIIIIPLSVTSSGVFKYIEMSKVKPTITSIKCKYLMTSQSLVMLYLKQVV